MKTRFLDKIITVAFATVCAGSMLTSCSKWDEFKKYTEDGEIVYSGKLDSIKILPGNERIKITALLPADPNIVKARVFWNNMTDSAEIPVDVSQGRHFSHILPVTEGLKSFTIYTYNSKGNKSVPVYATGAALGARYSNSISNRVPTTAVNVNSATTINWVSADLSTNPIFTEIKYEATGGEKVAKITASQDIAVIADLATTAKTFSYRTAYLPANSIDTFYTSYQTAGIYKDATGTYIPNASNPVAITANSGRWAIPANWITNDAVKNYKHTDGNKYGGVDHWFGGPFLAMEAGWSWDNMDSFRNGKIYQSPLLPAANYIIEIDVPDCTIGGRFYLVASEGNEISNIESIESAIAYAKTDRPGTHRISFKLSESKKVSIGVVGSLTNAKDRGEFGGEFFRVNAFRLLKLDAIN